MFREKIVTIIIGLFVGAILAGAFFFGPTLLKNFQSPEQKTVETTPTPKETKEPVPSEIKLVINSPVTESSTTNSDLAIKGKANSSAKLLIFTNSDEKHITAKGDGTFETNVKLEDGENEISITDLTEPIQTVTINVTLEISE